ncbi:hypothetical protein [Marinomonas aquiplantarum]|uniref:Tetratricopeptide repeat protein n=1 Tax=Marinomonas aquiplantarum TaxID=491951 RepID=A0A366CYE3_9GAMM|nr:hypothetical protein [Marinomonas aquiplantarum]RBO82645.1 hypothetical protein DFP76_105110 [Marinomonas aquiplantarum]
MSEPQVAFSEKLQEIETLCDELTFARSFFGKRDEFTIHRMTQNIEHEVAKLINSAPFVGYSAEMMLATACADRAKLDEAYYSALSCNENETVSLNYAMGLRMMGQTKDAIAILEKLAFCNPPSINAVRELEKIYRYLGMYDQYLVKLEPYMSRLNLTVDENQAYASKALLDFFEERDISIEQYVEYNTFLDSFFSKYQIENFSVQSETITDEYEVWLSNLVTFGAVHDPMKVSDLNDLFIEELIEQEHLDEISDLVVTRFI